MEKELSYDEAMKRAEALIAQLEQSEAISVDEYKRIAAEATALLNHCKQEIAQLEEQLQAH
ncbi:MAG: exodeoxyribonuclease VII small subunit [Paludibacteraceae bacterium]|nr:exodeoxyribonuclease VII small subunit [Paludibacteraceae bacterium]